MMKKALLTLVTMFCVVAAQAQFCNTQKGAMLLYTHSDRKANVVRIDTTRISEVTQQDNKTIVEQISCCRKIATKDSIFDEHGEMKYVYSQNGTTARIIIDEKWGRETMKMLRTELVYYQKGANVLPDKEEFERELDENTERNKGAILIPLKKDVQEGEPIPEGRYALQMGFMKVSLEVSNGQYHGFERVTLPVGTFDCLKVSYKLRKKILYEPKTQYVTQWYAEGLGLVKEEITDKKGRLKQSKVLISVIEP